MNIECNNCGKHLFTHYNTDMVMAGIEAMNKGFIYKNAMLFTGVDTKLFFCNEDCKKPYYENNIPKNKEISDILKQMKKEIPDMAAAVCNRMGNLSKAFKK